MQTLIEKLNRTRSKAGLKPVTVNRTREDAQKILEENYGSVSVEYNEIDGWHYEYNTKDIFDSEGNKIARSTILKQLQSTWAPTRKKAGSPRRPSAEYFPVLFIRPSLKSFIDFAQSIRTEYLKKHELKEREPGNGKEVGRQFGFADDREAVAYTPEEYRRLRKQEVTQ